MNTELELQQNTPRPVAPFEGGLNPHVAALGAWAQSASATQQVAAALVQSSFVPAAFRGKPIEATAAILAGAEIGLQPMTALKAFDVIQGAAAPRAITLRAVVQSAGHEIVLVESTATRCRMKGRRKGETTWQTVDWTIDRAKQLGVTGKDNWKKQPQAMLVARATSELARLVAADAILGIAYSAEEVADGAGEALDVTVEPQAARAKRTLSRKRKPATPNAESPVDAAPEPEPDPVEAPPVEGEAATRPQLQKLNILMEQMLGSNDRDAKLNWLSGRLNREVMSSKDLTKSEASAAIEDLLTPPFEAGEPA